MVGLVGCPNGGAGWSIGVFHRPAEQFLQVPDNMLLVQVPELPGQCRQLLSDG